MARVGRPRSAVVVGTALVVGAYVALIATGPQPPDVVRAAITGLGIFGAAIIIRTIPPSSRPPERDDDYPDGPPPL